MFVNKIMKNKVFYVSHVYSIDTILQFEGVPVIVKYLIAKHSPWVNN